MTEWIAPDSSVQSRADVYTQKRKTFLMTGMLDADVDRDEHGNRTDYLVSLVAATDLGVPAQMSAGREDYAWYEDYRYLPNEAEMFRPGDVEVTVTQADKTSIKMNVRARWAWGWAPQRESWTQTARVEAAYGQATPVELPDTPHQTTRLLLRVERLKQ